MSPSGLLDTTTTTTPGTLDSSPSGQKLQALSVPGAYPKLRDGDKIPYVLATFRCLIADLCQQFNGGHPGGAMGMAGIGIALWKYVMKYSPNNPDYFNRDRFVLSNGHCCLFQYAFLHLTGYAHMSMDQLKSYHSARADAMCPGHPEIELPGIEVTTGPLGQGLANAVGLAVAAKHLASVYNRPGFPVVDNTIWCMVGDACLQEGVGLEAISLAGHWRLDNLVVVYDNNQVSCDGSVDLTNTEDVNAKMRACGWNVIEIADGCLDVEAIVDALQTARRRAATTTTTTDQPPKPTFVNVHTIIGIGSRVQGQAQAHGVAFGADEVARIKRHFGMPADQSFHVADAVYDFFGEAAASKGRQLETAWADLLASYGQAYPDLAAEFTLRIEGQLTRGRRAGQKDENNDWRALIPTRDQLPTEPTASRKSAGLVCNPLAAALPSMMVGTADLSPSVNMIWKDKVDFQRPDLQTTCGINGDYSGRYIHYGIREHAMAAISNGLAAYNKGTILPVTSSFFMFYIYAAPAVRMGALQGLQQIHIATHDSIGTGEDGPTHQPIALAALYRAMPNLLYIRPCDSEEVAGAFLVALQATRTPSILSLSRQALPQYHQHPPSVGRSARDGVLRGGYVFREPDEGDAASADVTLIGVGAEMGLAVQTAQLLQDQYGTTARIVSMPCQRLFDKQPEAYRRQVLRPVRRMAGGQRRGPAVVVVIEAYAAQGWERYADAGFCMSSFGVSLPGRDAYRHFGFDEAVIAPAVKALVDEVRVEGLDRLRGCFRDLNPNRGHFAY